MSWSLISSHGQRKYLTPNERAAFIGAALVAEPIRGTFCLTLALTGARISEVLALTARQVDRAENTIVLETLKRRRKGIYRAVPVPRELIDYLSEVHALRDPSRLDSVPLWRFSRPTAWKYVKRLMSAADVPAEIGTPRALRHAFGVEAVQKRIALSLIRKWLGHAKIETTAIYADPVGEEERALARLMWKGVGSLTAALKKSRLASRVNI